MDGDKKRRSEEGPTTAGNNSRQTILQLSVSHQYFNFCYVFDIGKTKTKQENNFGNSFDTALDMCGKRQKEYMMRSSIIYLRQIGQKLVKSENRGGRKAHTEILYMIRRHESFDRKTQRFIGGNKN